MSTYKFIKKRVQSSSLKQITKELEYNSTLKAEKIIHKFLSSKDLYSWLHSGYYDFKYTPELFLRKICKIFQLNYKNIEDELHKQKLYYNEVKRVKNNFIFVNTNFKRKNEPIFALACLEHRRRVHLHVKNVVFKNIEQILQIVAKQVRQHYKETQGKLNIWGEIVNYVYYHENEIFTFDTHGEIIKNQGKRLC